MFSFMGEITLSQPQAELARLPVESKIFLEGPDGSGKTTAGVARLLGLLERGVPGASVLLLVPQRSLGQPYLHALRTASLPPGSPVALHTLSGLAQRMVELYWPLVGGAAGFGHPDMPPVFLTLETAQYYLARLVRPLFDEGFFASITLDRNRLYSQILDNLNKSAVVGFAHTQIGQRLVSAWGGEPGQARVYQDAQECASRFRQYCLEHNLLDFSLQVELFVGYLWPDEGCRGALLETYRHLIVENLEEDVPVTHDLLAEWLPHLDSCLLIYDQEAGYRSFLGADPRSAYRLKALCPQRVTFTGSFVASPMVIALGERLGRALQTGSQAPASPPPGTSETSDSLPAYQAALSFEVQRFYPQMLDWVAGQVAQLVQDEGVPPEEIAILAPFLGDALRFSLANRLERYGIPARSHRPSRSLREQPPVQCLLTLTYLAHPGWALPALPTQFDLAYALMQSLEGMDLVRAQLLAEKALLRVDGQPRLLPFERVKADLQERVTYRLGERYEHLRQWLEGYAQAPAQELDHFLGRLFGEVLSQPGFGFHANLDAGEAAANLVESAQKFRRVAAVGLADLGKPVGQEYLEMVQDGVIAAQYLRSWRGEAQGAVLLAPAYTFLMSNRPVEVQFWLDVGSRSWYERLYQPLTQPHVLSRNWPDGKHWTDDDEYKTSQEALYRLALGLLARCRHRVYLGLSELGEQGYEQRGLLLRAFQRLLRAAPQEASGV